MEQKKDKTSIELTKKFRERLTVHKAKGRYKSYEEMLVNWEALWLSSLQHAEEKQPLKQTEYLKSTGQQITKKETSLNTIKE